MSDIKPPYFKVPRNILSLFDNFEWPEDVPQKPLEELTEEQKKRVLDRYRFSGFQSNQFQGITGGVDPYS